MSEPKKKESKSQEVLKRHARYFERGRNGAFQKLTEMTDKDVVDKILEIVDKQEEKINSLLDLIKEISERPPREVVKELQPIKSEGKDPRVDALEREIKELKASKSKALVVAGPPLEPADLTPALDQIKELADIVRKGFANVDEINERFNDRVEDVENIIMKVGVAAVHHTEEADSADEPSDQERKSLPG